MDYSSLANSAVGGLIGIGTSEMQNNAQEHLMNVQLNNQMQLNEQAQQLAIKTFNQTGAGAQVRQLKEAGLNPALMYKQGGASGTTSFGSGGGASGGQSANFGDNVNKGAMMGLAAQAQESEIEVNKAQADLLRAEAEKKRGYEKDNVVANTDLTKINTNIAKVEEEFRKGTLDVDIMKATSMASKAASDAGLAGVNYTVASATQQVAINTIYREYALLGIEGELKKSHIELNRKQLNKIDKDIENMQKNTNLRGEELENSKDWTKKMDEYHDELINLGWAKMTVDAVIEGAKTALGGKTTIKENAVGPGGVSSKTTTINKRGF